MSWCDKLASSVGIGFRLDPSYVSSAALLDAAAPVLEKLNVREKAGFELEKQEPFSLQFVTNDGYQYGLTSTNVYIEFVYRLRLRNKSGGPPVAEMLSSVIPYSQQIPEVARRLEEITALLPGAKSRTIKRVGVVSATNANLTDAPPGIRRFIDYLGRPWKQELDSLNFRVSAMLPSSPGSTVRCIHTLTKPEDKEELTHFKFDWQRIFSTGKRIESKSMRELIADATRDANRYFEDLAEGNRFDEDILRQTV